MPRRSRLRLALFSGCFPSSPFALAVPSAYAAAPEWRGVHLHSLWAETSNADMDRELDLARDSGANVVRVDVGWSSLETGGKGPGAWYLDKLDHLVNGANARGMKVMPGVVAPRAGPRAPRRPRSRAARAAGGTATVTMYPPTNNHDFADIAVWVIARRYDTKLAALEVWNEPNLDEDRFWIAPDEPRAYAEMLKAAYPASSRPLPTFRSWPAPSPSATTPSCAHVRHRHQGPLRRHGHSPLPRQQPRAPDLGAAWTGSATCSARPATTSRCG